MKVSKIINFKKYKLILIIISIIFFLLLLAYYFYKNYNSYKIIPENKETFKFTVKPSLFDENNIITEMLFEPADLDYYEYNPLPLPEQIIFPDQNINVNEIIPQEIYVPNIDLQNVHDTTINKYIRKLFSDINTIENPNIINEIKQSITGLEPAKQEIIKQVLNDINKRNGTITNLNGISELSVLSSVWDVSKNDNNIKDMLFQQIQDTYENGYTLCPTGFVNRISTALLINKIENFPKTKGIIRDEMFNTAANIRTELEKDDLYNTLTDNEQSTELKNRLLNKYQEDYKGILDKDEINDITKDWIEFV